MTNRPKASGNLDGARGLDARMARMPDHVQTQAVERTRQLFDRWGTRNRVSRLYAQLRDELKTCTGSRLGACYHGNVASIYKGNPALGQPVVLLHQSENDFALIRTQDALDFWAPARDGMYTARRWLGTYGFSEGRVEYGPLQLIDDGERGGQDDDPSR